MVKKSKMSQREILLHTINGQSESIVNEFEDALKLLGDDAHFQVERTIRVENPENGRITITHVQIQTEDFGKEEQDEDDELEDE